MRDENIILETKDLCKSFGQTKANIQLNISFYRGEVHGIAGENGSGKSTLLSQLAGILPSDSGEILLNGAPYRPQSPLDAFSNHISMVVQELGVIGNLPAGVNMFSGHMEDCSRHGIINMRTIRKEVERVCSEWNLPAFPVEMLCEKMNVEQRKMVELARALSLNPEILILDEITQALSHNNRSKLYDVINRLRDMNKTVILITHDIEELVEITDRITVMRDGEVVTTVRSEETTPNQIKSLMVNRNVDGDFYRSDNEPSAGEQVVADVRNLTVEGSLHDISFQVHAGEILGFCGLSDSGIHDIGKAMYGLVPGIGNAMHLVPKDLYITNPTLALFNGIGYLPKDRDGEGLMIDDDIEDNFCLPSYDELSGKLGTLTGRMTRKAAADAMERFRVKASDGYQYMNSLSGGNKQKVNLGRWLIKDLSLMILDCPTRGVDIGVKAYIYQEMMRAKEAGLAIVLISDELLEALGMSDRLMVVKDGRIVKELQRGDSFTEENVIEVMI